MDSLQASLAAKSWFGFDLDDTLHEFRAASGTVSLAVFEAIYSQHRLPIEYLQQSYSSILAQMTANAFACGKTSIEYRKERFALLLQAHHISFHYTYLEKLAAIHKRALSKALEPKPGALALFQHLKRTGKTIIIITEGPRDAQEWTIEQLGLTQYVDILVTTNETGIAKVDGLFGEVLRRYRIKAEDMVWVGDSETRDVVPAAEAGILSILYDEKSDCQLDGSGQPSSRLSINSLTKLEHILRMGTHAAGKGEH
ncbi:hypothetical protein H2201_004264 [Coniosporium apollinis]|uniref:Uncharacterized protein n=2 Tax=Coniosporium TaxID=2810619 RepID=A0ABQ9NYA6_9PEZI|nr:hypothetical protein H2199_000031 [Cladosporium sp. JES 115]KAJ9665573.1 hypothetical protein H2201_004264 [Coniosporium apollinis]